MAMTGPGASDDAATPGNPLSEALTRAQGLVDEATRAVEERDLELRRQQSMLDAVLAAAGPVAVLEAEVVRAWSGALEVLTGLSAVAVLGRRLRTVAPHLVTDAPWSDERGARWRVVTSVHDPWTVLVLEPTDEPSPPARRLSNLEH
jgi:PAS domain-containing protein